MSLAIHYQTQHIVTRGGSGQKDNEGDRGDEPRTFKMTFPKKAGPTPCPVKECSVRADMWTFMWVHLWHWHVQDTVVILEENPPHSR